MGVVRQTSFSAGEVAPEFYARTDMAKYAHAARLCKNFIVDPRGPVKNRPGTRLVNEVKVSATGKVRLLPFIFSNGQSFVLEFGGAGGGFNDYLRFYTLGARVLATGSPAYSALTDYKHDEYVTSAGTTWRALQANGPSTVVVAPGTNPAVWSNQAIYEISQPFENGDLPRVKYAQVGDTVFLTHQDYGLFALQRLSSIHWTLTPYAIGTPSIAKPTTLAVASTAVEPDPTDPDGHVGKAWAWVVTAVSPAGEESLVSAHVGGTPRVLYPDRVPTVLTWAHAGATTYRVYRGLFPGADPPIYGFVGEAASKTWTDNGELPDYLHNPPDGTVPFDGEPPAVVGFFEQRLILANSPSYPHRIEASKTGAFRDFSSSIVPLASDAIDITLAAVRYEEIRSLLPLGVLFALGASHWTVSGDQGGPLTPSSLQARPQFFSAVSWLDPIPINNAYLSIQEKGDVVRDMASQLRQNASGGYTQGYLGDDLTVLARHLFEGRTIVDWAYARDPGSVVWAIRDDGALLGLTYIKDQDVWAWHQHDTEGLFENVCVVPEGGEDAVYVVVNRTIAGSTRRYIERFASRVVSDVKTGIFLDAALAYNGTKDGSILATMAGFSTYTAGSAGNIQTTGPAFSPAMVGEQVWLNASTTPVKCIITGYTATNQVAVELVGDVAGVVLATSDWAIATDTFAGLDHLEGETVGVLGDGAPLTPVAVAGGRVTIDTPAVFAVIGLRYTPELDTLDLAPPNAEARTAYKVVTRAWFEVIASRGIYAGEDADHLRPFKQRAVSDSYGAIPLKSDIFPVDIDQTWNRGGRAVIVQKDPLPLTVLSFGREYELGGSGS